MWSASLERQASCAFPSAQEATGALLSLTRVATPDSQERPNRLVVTYQDTLPGLPSQRCKGKATTALGLAVQVFQTVRSVLDFWPFKKAQKGKSGHFALAVPHFFCHP